jgi:hypothetical protein
MQTIAKELDLTLDVEEDTDKDGEVIATRVIKAPGFACYHSKFQPTGMKNLFMSNVKVWCIYASPRTLRDFFLFVRGSFSLCNTSLQICQTNVANSMCWY